MSKKNKGKKRKTSGTHKARLEKLRESAEAYKVIHGAKVWKPKPLRNRSGK